MGGTLGHMNLISWQNLMRQQQMLSNKRQFTIEKWPVGETGENHF